MPQPTRLQSAIARGSQPGGDLPQELRNLRGYKITSAEDADAICDALSLAVESAPAPQRDITIDALIHLFQDVEDGKCPAFSIMLARGVPLLISYVEEVLRDPAPARPDPALFAIKILAMYQTDAGAQTSSGQRSSL